MRSPGLKVLVLLAVAIVAGLAVFNVITTSGAKSVSFSDLMHDMKFNKVDSVDWQGEVLSGRYVDGTRYTARFVSPNEPAAVDFLRLIESSTGSSRPIHLRILDKPASSLVLSVISILAFPLMLIALIYFLVLRPAQMNPPRVSRGSSEPGVVDELERLSRLRESGMISDEEFKEAKSQVLRGEESRW